MAYRMVYLRVRSSGYHFGWTSDTDQAAFKEESRRIFQELGWGLKPGRNGVCDTVTKGHQDLYLHPTSFNGVMDEADIQPLQEHLSKAQTFNCYHCDRYEEYLDWSDEEYRAALEAKRGEITDFILKLCNSAVPRQATTVRKSVSRTPLVVKLRSTASRKLVTGMPLCV